MRGLIREPTTLIAVVQSALALLVTFQLDMLTAEQAAAITAVVSLLAAAVNAALVRPLAPAAFVQLLGGGAALLAAYGFNVSPETVGALQALVVTLVAMQVRGQVTPKMDPRPDDVVVG
jgi:hypothetical protein